MLRTGTTRRCSVSVRTYYFHSPMSDRRIAAALSERYLLSSEMMLTARQYYSELSASIPSIHIIVWEADIVSAESTRLVNPAKMDIMAVRPGSGVRQEPRNESQSMTVLEETITLALLIEQKQ